MITKDKQREGKKGKKGKKERKERKERKRKVLRLKLEKSVTRSR